MENFYSSIVQTIQSGQSLVLVCVIESSGSTPRHAGAMMMIDEKGNAKGTIGGGAIEHQAQQQAKKLLETKRSQIIDYNLSANDAANLGMVCGGSVRVLFQYLSGDQYIELFDYLNKSAERNENAWLIRSLKSGEVTSMGVYDPSGLHFTDSLNAGELQKYLINKAVLVRGEQDIFIEPAARSGRVYIFGGGHISQELVPIIAHVGFLPVVFEDREQFANVLLFPSAVELIIGNYGELDQYLSINTNDYIVVVTRGHQADYEVLKQVLRSKATYIGCIGSRRKIEYTRARLLEAGLTTQDIIRLHAPIGLDIKAETPAEIAISIAAEMILHRATRG